MIDRELVEQVQREDPDFVRRSRCAYLRGEIARIEAELDADLAEFYKVRDSLTVDRVASMLIMKHTRDTRTKQINTLRAELKSWRAPVADGRVTEAQIARARAFPITELVGAAVGEQVLCPAHPDKTPSAHVYPWGVMCFTCQFHADAIGWLRKVRGLSFADAVRALAP